MIKRRIALIGHSCAGKSACLIALKGNPAGAEMDRGLGTNASPPMQKAIEWIVTNQEPVVVVSVHKHLLVELSEAKSKRNNETFDKLFFVYLHKRRDKLEECLQKDVQDGRRSNGNALATLNTYDELDGIFESLADQTIDTSDVDIERVAKAIESLQASYEGR